MKKKLRGINIYLDELDRNVYVDPIGKEAYLIQESNFQMYNFYSNRFILVIGAVVLFASFFGSFYLSVAITVLLFGLLEFFFRRRFLPTLIKLDNFKPDRKLSYEDQETMNNDKKKTILKVIMFILLGVLLGINAYMEGYQGFELGLSVVFVLYAAFMSFINLKVLIKNRK